MGIDAKLTLEKLKGETDKGQVTLYLHKPTFDEFKKACGETSPSRVVDQLISEFVASATSVKADDELDEALVLASATKDQALRSEIAGHIMRLLKAQKSKSVRAK